MEWNDCRIVVFNVATGRMCKRRWEEYIHQCALLRCCRFFSFLHLERSLNFFFFSFCITLAGAGAGGSLIVYKEQTGFFSFLSFARPSISSHRRTDIIISCLGDVLSVITQRVDSLYIHFVGMERKCRCIRFKYIINDQPENRNLLFYNNI